MSAEAVLTKQETGANPDSQTGRIEAFYQKVAADNVPEFRELVEAWPDLGAVDLAENSNTKDRTYWTKEGVLDKNVAETSLERGNPDYWECTDDQFDAWNHAADADDPKKLSDKHLEEFGAYIDKHKDLYPGEELGQIYGHYRDYAKKRVKLAEYLSDPADAAVRYGEEPVVFGRDAAVQETDDAAAKEKIAAAQPKVEEVAAKVTHKRTHRKPGKELKKHLETEPDALEGLLDKKVDENGKARFVNPKGEKMKAREISMVLENRDKILAGIPELEASQTAEQVSPGRKRRSARSEAFTAGESNPIIVDNPQPASRENEPKPEVGNTPVYEGDAANGRPRRKATRKQEAVGEIDGTLTPQDAPEEVEIPQEELDEIKRAAELVLTTQFGSVSMLQRKLRVGFDKANRMMDELERQGFVAEAEGHKSRVVIKSGTPEEISALIAGISRVGRQYVEGSTVAPAQANQDPSRENTPTASPATQPAGAATQSANPSPADATTESMPALTPEGVIRMPLNLIFAREQALYAKGQEEARAAGERNYVTDTETAHLLAHIEEAERSGTLPAPTAGPRHATPKMPLRDRAFAKYYEGKERVRDFMTDPEKAKQRKLGLAALRAAGILTVAGLAYRGYETSGLEDAVNGFGNDLDKQASAFLDGVVAPDASQAPTTPDVALQPPSHVELVDPGDTVSKIVDSNLEAHGITELTREDVQRTLDANQLGWDTVIQPGQEITVIDPGAPVPVEALAQDVMAEPNAFQKFIEKLRDAEWNGESGVAATAVLALVGLAKAKKDIIRNRAKERRRAA